MKHQNIKNIYILGYPKSGNTWLSRLVSDLTNSKICTGSIFDKINSSENSNKKNNKYNIYKIHNLDILQTIENSYVIYIVRDIRDVLVSSFFHFNRWCDEDKLKNNFLLKTYFDYKITKLSNFWHGNLLSRFYIYIFYFFKKILLIKNSNPQNIGNWSRHVKTSLESKKINIFIKYEDLLSDPFSQIDKIRNSLNIKISDYDLNKIIKRQGFLRKKQFFLESGDMQNYKFLRTGKSGSWKTLFSKNLTKYINKQHYYVLRRLKYL